MFSSSSFDHTAPSLRTSQILGHKRQRCHPPSTDFGLSWLLLPLVKPVLVRSSARSNEDTTSRFLSKITQIPSTLITWTPTAYRKSCEKLPRTKPPECRWNSSGTRWRTCAGPSRVRISSLSLFALSFKVFDVHKSFPRDSGESGLFLPRFGVYAFVLSSDQLLLYTP